MLLLLSKPMSYYWHHFSQTEFLQSGRQDFIYLQGSSGMLDKERGYLFEVENLSVRRKLWKGESDEVSI